MIRALEDDFKKVVGIRQVMSDYTLGPSSDIYLFFLIFLFTEIGVWCSLALVTVLLDWSLGFFGCSWYLWVFVVVFLLLNVNGTVLHFSVYDYTIINLIKYAMFCYATGPSTWISRFFRLIKMSTLMYLSFWDLRYSWWL